jgi:hypothetical protein
MHIEFKKSWGGYAYYVYSPEIYCAEIREMLVSRYWMLDNLKMEMPFIWHPATSIQYPASSIQYHGTELIKEL